MIRRRFITNPMLISSQNNNLEERAAHRKAAEQ
jgi:hypothetical protein